MVSISAPPGGGAAGGGAAAVPQCMICLSAPAAASVKCTRDNTHVICARVHGDCAGAGDFALRAASGKSGPQITSRFDALNTSESSTSGAAPCPFPDCEGIFPLAVLFGQCFNAAQQNDYLSTLHAHKCKIESIAQTRAARARRGSEAPLSAVDQLINATVHKIEMQASSQCPNCEATWSEFSDGTCAALQCNYCGVIFCGLCDHLVESRAAVHRNTEGHDHLRKEHGGMFFNKEIVQRAQEVLKRKKIEDTFKTLRNSGCDLELRVWHKVQGTVSAELLPPASAVYPQRFAECYEFLEQVRTVAGPEMYESVMTRLSRGFETVREWAGPVQPTTQMRLGRVAATVKKTERSSLEQECNADILKLLVKFPVLFHAYTDCALKSEGLGVSHTPCDFKVGARYGIVAAYSGRDAEKACAPCLRLARGLFGNGMIVKEEVTNVETGEVVLTVIPKRCVRSPTPFQAVVTRDGTFACMSLIDQPLHRVERCANHGDGKTTSLLLHAELCLSPVRLRLRMTGEKRPRVEVEPAADIAEHLPVRAAVRLWKCMTQEEKDADVLLPPAPRGAGNAAARAQYMTYWKPESDAGAGLAGRCTALACEVS